MLIVYFFFGKMLIAYLCVMINIFNLMSIITVSNSLEVFLKKKKKIASKPETLLEN